MYEVAVTSCRKRMASRRRSVQITGVAGKPLIPLYLEVEVFDSAANTALLFELFRQCF